MCKLTPFWAAGGTWGDGVEFYDQSPASVLIWTRRACKIKAFWSLILKGSIFQYGIYIYIYVWALMGFLYPYFRAYACTVKIHGPVLD